MRKGSAFFLGLACFVGVFGALQADRWLTVKQDSMALAPVLGKAMPVVESEAAMQGTIDFRSAAKKVMPSVVSVDQFVRTRRWWEEESTLRESGSGSGVILARNGTIVTNNHVIADPRDSSRRTVASQIRVRLHDGKSYTARVLGNDPRSDLAVLKIEAANLTPIEMGDSSRLETGQWVLAAGNPLGFEGTLSVGVVSSLGRSIDIEGLYLTDSIQTDAAINPGNSGGALTDTAGRLVGINSAIASRTGGSVGIGFSIPVNRMRQVVDDIVKLGYVRYAGLGVRYNESSVLALRDPRGREQVKELAGAEPPSQGVLLLDVDASGAAYGAGLRQWDILLEVGGTKIEDLLSMNRILNRLKPGDTIAVRYWSRGQTKSTNIRLQEIRS